MHAPTLSSQTVVDHLCSELAQQRYARAQRRAAYLALARAILHDDGPGEHQDRPAAAPTAATVAA
jgi:hypothetical protein